MLKWTLFIIEIESSMHLLVSIHVYLENDIRYL